MELSHPFIVKKIPLERRYHKSTEDGLRNGFPVKHGLQKAIFRIKLDGLQTGRAPSEQTNNKEKSEFFDKNVKTKNLLQLGKSWLRGENITKIKVLEE
ncbi:hypothetical protein [Paenibacillus sp. J2TS4]|uniref:hypothetical protein n=1 Tax=Paenibacillus sp. J2TS4 TaxID=2807194 RepID=UPI001B1DF9D8|nr:hypothetical protein [Paenibacillus sp. J2TS4]GIP30800.1 hypothetical protein J2TS4_00100 [Paenibacillus sp. J2TS4]